MSNLDVRILATPLDHEVPADVASNTTAITGDFADRSRIGRVAAVGWFSFPTGQDVHKVECLREKAGQGGDVSDGVATDS